MYFMTLPRSPSVRLHGCQVFGNEVQSLDCPRNGKRDKAASRPLRASVGRPAAP